MLGLKLIRVSKRSPISVLYSFFCAVHPYHVIHALLSICGSVLGTWWTHDMVHQTFHGRSTAKQCSRALSQYKDRLSRYGDFHYKDRMVMIVSYLYNGNLYTGNMASLYWNGPQGAVSVRKTVLPGMAILMLKIRRPNGRLIFNMEIAIRR